MCGIVGAIAQRDVVQILLEGLKRLEYRGYDSAGIALINEQQEIDRRRVLGKVAKLDEALSANPITGRIGIAHTRWATHGQPTEANAHPHCSQQEVGVVHNGIIENHEQLRGKLTALGYQFHSETDTEVICHLIHYHWQTHQDMTHAIQHTQKELKGAYALGVISHLEPDTLYAIRRGSPLVIGLGIGENFIASDQLALLPVTQRFIYLEEGDIAKVNINQIDLFDSQNKKVERQVHKSSAHSDVTRKGKFRHFMLKEIFDQPKALSETLDGHVSGNHVASQIFGFRAEELFKRIKRMKIVACGTSYHAGLVGAHWMEALAGIPCHTEIASEQRYRNTVVEPDCLFVALSQSGETADTLAAIRQAKNAGYAATLGICNVPESSLMRETDLVFLTRAGTEIGVAATKTFTAQLTALLLLSLALGQYNKLSKTTAKHVTQTLRRLPALVQEILTLDKTIKRISKRFANKQHALFLGRGELYPIAMEGALKLKEISYVHAESYPAGELKHGPLALVDENMPVIVIAPNNALLEKLESNVQEVQARGGELYIFAEDGIDWKTNDNSTLIKMPAIPEALSPIAYTIPLQLLSYHIAILKGTDVDQPRNLAKSVTVE